MRSTKGELLQIGNKEVKVSLFEDDTIVYISNLKLYQVILTADKHLYLVSIHFAKGVYKQPQIIPGNSYS